MTIDPSIINLFTGINLNTGNGSSSTNSLGNLGTPGGSGISAYPGGSVAYFNYLAKSGDKLQHQSNNSPAVSKEVAYFLSRIGQKTAAKPTSLVKINANLSPSDAPASSRATTTNVYDSKGDKYTLTLKFTKAATDVWQVSLGSLVDASGNKTPTTATVNSTPQTVTFDTLGHVASAIGQFSLGTITLSNGATLTPKFSLDGGAPNGGLVTQKPASSFTLTSVQADGNPSVSQGNKPVKTVDDIFKDHRLFTFVLTALGLGDQIQNVGLVKKALTEKLFDSHGQPIKGTLISKLHNAKLSDAAKTLDMGDVGLKAIENPIIINALIGGYQTNVFEQGIATNDPAVASARYFARNVAQAVSSATTTTNAAFTILGDKVLRDVVTTALNIPPGGLASLPVASQAAVVMKHVNVNSFKQPAFVTSFVSRYLNTVQNQASEAQLKANGQIGLARFGFKI
jgi:flagellar hook protein FlgE